MNTQSLTRDDELDRTVAEFADRLARDEDPRREELLARHPDCREELSRCFRMIEAGLVDDLPVAADLAGGVTLGDFRVGEELGRGGMGVVYRAEQISLQREVALKVLRPHLTVDARQIDRFHREARAAARLSHENLVPVHTVGSDGGHHFIAMELVAGPGLDQVLEEVRSLERPPTAVDFARATGDLELAAAGSYPAAVCRWFAQVLTGVQAAHDAGFIHRDLKPSNILLDERGIPKVADFGLAKADGDLGLSATGEALGTPHYMAPEQASAASETIGRRTDVYALGVTLYEMLLLRRPFSGDSYPELLTSILHRDPPAPRAVDGNLPIPIEAVILKAMAKDSSRRYGSCAEFAADLDNAAAGRAIIAPTQGGLTGILSGYFEARTRNMPYEYKSRRRFLGLPLLHIACGIRDPRTGRQRIAKGWMAAGDVAVGVYAVGFVSIGFLTLGLFGIGVISLGLGVIGVNAIGGAALGWEAQGVLAAGAYADGTMATLTAYPPGADAPEVFESSAPALPFGDFTDVFIALIASLVLPLILNGILHARIRGAPERRAVSRATWIGTPILMASLVLLHKTGVIPFWGFLVLYVVGAAVFSWGLTKWLRARGAWM